MPPTSTPCPVRLARLGGRRRVRPAPLWFCVALGTSPASLAQTWEQQVLLYPRTFRRGTALVPSAAVAPDWAVVGAERQVSSVDPGAAYLFRKTADGWLESTKLMASDAQAGDLFGGSVAMSGSRVISGGPQGESVWGPWSWAAYVFQRSPKGSWSEVAILSASDPNPGDWFGWSVGLWDEVAVVGAWRQNDDRGAAYVFGQGPDGWTQAAKLAASDAAAGDSFGFSVATYGDAALVGASGKDSGTGSVYVFEQANGSWTESARLTPTVSAR